MRDRTGFFAGFAELMSEMCIYYLVVGVLFMEGQGGWGQTLTCVLLCAAGCFLCFSLLLRRPRGVPLLTLVTGLLFAGVTAALLVTSSTPPRFGYILALGLGAGMAAGLSLHHCLHRPLLLNHLTHLDTMVLAVLGLLLCREATDVGADTLPLMCAVLLLDVAGAVGLRMSDGDGADGGSAGRATLAAMGGALLLTLLILLAVALFSHSGWITAALLHGLKSALAAIGKAIERLVFWLVSFVDLREDPGVPVTLAAASGEMSGVSGEMPEIPVNTTLIGILLCLLLLAAAIAVARQLRRKKLGAATRAPSAGGVRVRRRGGAAAMLRQRLLQALRFRWAAFVHRNTPAGVLVWLERRSRRARAPRGQGETMRAFLLRLVPDGGLEPLADALDREYYGSGAQTMSAGTCRDMRRYARRHMSLPRRRRDAGKTAPEQP